MISIKEIFRISCLSLISTHSFIKSSQSHPASLRSVWKVFKNEMQIIIPTTMKLLKGKVNWFYILLIIAIALVILLTFLIWVLSLILIKRQAHYLADRSRRYRGDSWQTLEISITMIELEWYQIKRLLSLHIHQIQ